MSFTDPAKQKANSNPFVLEIVIMSCKTGRSGCVGDINKMSASEIHGNPRLHPSRNK